MKGKTKQFGEGKRIKIDGETFTLRGGWPNKPKAKSRAKDWREKGYKARVVKHGHAHWVATKKK